MNRNKVLIALTILVLLSFFSIQSISAATPITVVLDGESMSFDVPPMMIEGRTMVPVRGIFEALGAEITWDPQNRKIVATTKDVQVVLYANNQNARINDANVQLDVPATIMDGRTFVPLRFVSESLGANVEWDHASNTAIIESTQRVAADELSTRRMDPYFGLYVVDVSDLGEATLTREQAKALSDDLQELKDSIKTVADFYLYLDEKGFQSRSGDTHVRDGDMTWYHNVPAEISIQIKRVNCGGAANLAYQLLMDNYDEVGFISDTAYEGGHIINYIKHNGEVYITDFSSYVGVGNEVIFNDTFENFAEFLVRIHEEKFDRKTLTIVKVFTDGEDFIIGRSHDRRYEYYPEIYEVTPLYLDGVSIETRELNQLPASYNTQ